MTGRRGWSKALDFLRYRTQRENAWDVTERFKSS